MNRDLRPSHFDEFIGQKKLIETIKAMIFSSKKQKKCLDHILFYGLPGTGKTSLASIIANETNAAIHYIQAANVEKKSDLISILSTINEGDILFIDEIHSLNKLIEELLYNAMEYFVFDIVLGAESNAKTMRMKIKKFTLIGATTKLNVISQPFKDRFGFIAKFNPYEIDELEKIIQNSANILKIKIESKEVKYICKYSKSTPRIANNLLKRANDFRIVQEKEIIDLDILKTTFDYLDLYEFGLSKDHLDYLELLRDSFEEKWASLDTITGILSSNKENVINDIEPLLLYYRLIKKSSRGRQITSLGIDYVLRNKLMMY